MSSLAVNARDAMNAGGTLAIETAIAEFDETYAHGKVDVTPGAYVMISVSDTGTGILKDDIDNIFEPFFTAKKRGKAVQLHSVIDKSITTKNILKKQTYETH